MYNTEHLLAKKEINGKELEFLLSERKSEKTNFLLVDVREEYEYNEKKIVGVDYLIPLSDFFNKVNQIDDYKSVPIITKCKLEWCKIKVDKFSGWVKKESLWGLL